jgi:hypothetical protein
MPARVGANPNPAPSTARFNNLHLKTTTFQGQPTGDTLTGSYLELLERVLHKQRKQRAPGCVASCALIFSKEVIACSNKCDRFRPDLPTVSVSVSVHSQRNDHPQVWLLCIFTVTRDHPLRLFLPSSLPETLLSLFCA